MNERDLSNFAMFTEVLIRHPFNYPNLIRIFKDGGELKGDLLSIVNFLESSCVELKLETFDRETSQEVLLKFTRSLSDEDTSLGCQISRTFDWAWNVYTGKSA